MAAERILVVDDEPGVRGALESVLSDEGFHVVTAETGEAGIEELERQAFDAIMLNVWLPGIDGLETLKRVRERRSDTEVVMISGHGTIETAVRATKLGAFDFVEKPLSLEKTLLVLRNALRHRRLEQRNLRLLEQLARDTEIVGRSVAAVKLRREVELAAASEAAVLICGEPGVGRERVARRVHSAGARAEGPFVELPCGALAAAAADAALFGQRGEPGRLLLAAGGCLFLENADRLAPRVQRKLAGTLESDSGPARTVRVVASAGPAAEQLDERLRHLLDVIRIQVPALRERREDIPLLAEGFMRDLAREYGRPSKRLAPDCLSTLQAHSWPGNVRELQNLMERLLFFAEQEVVEKRDLPESLGGAHPPAEDLYREFASLSEGLEAFERYYVARVLSAEGANRRAAAKRLGLTPAALERRLKKL